MRPLLPPILAATCVACAAARPAEVPGTELQSVPPLGDAVVTESIRLRLDEGEMVFVRRDGFRMSLVPDCHLDGVVTTHARLAAFADDVPRGACEGANLVVVGVRYEMSRTSRVPLPEAFLLLPVDPTVPGLGIRAARKVAYASEVGTSWSVVAGRGRTLCTLPCSVWVLPEESLLLAESEGAGGLRRWTLTRTEDSDAAEVKVCTEKRRGWPLAFSLFGAGVGLAGAATSVAIAASVAGDTPRDRVGAVLLPIFFVPAGLGLAAYALSEARVRDVPVAKPTCGGAHARR